MPEPDPKRPPTPYRPLPLDYAGFWARALALGVDFLILAACAVPLALTGDGILLMIPAAIAYLPLMWWHRGATLGQGVAGIRVVRASDGRRMELWRAALRGLVWWLDFALIRYFVGLAGFALAAVEPRKRALHDLLAGTVVVLDESRDDTARAFREPGAGLFDGLTRPLSRRRKGRGSN
jgi:uncharacterized RDD family membrane protein YckC